MKYVPIISQGNHWGAKLQVESSPDQLHFLERLSTLECHLHQLLRPYCCFHLILAKFVQASLTGHSFHPYPLFTNNLIPYCGFSSTVSVVFLGLPDFLPSSTYASKIRGSSSGRNPRSCAFFFRRCAVLSFIPVFAKTCAVENPSASRVKAWTLCASEYRPP